MIKIIFIKPIHSDHFLILQIVSLKHLMRPKDPQNLQDLNIVMEYCPWTLKSFMAANSDKIDLDHIKYFTYEIVKGVLFMHLKGIMHRDLKPLSILATDGMQIKISDFGQSNVKTNDINQDYNLTRYVTTRFYRAPELYLDYETNYSTAVDMWSIGCIIAEFFNKQIFVIANSDDEYLESLLRILGAPSENIRSEIRNKKFLCYLTETQTIR